MCTTTILFVLMTKNNRVYCSFFIFQIDEAVYHDQLVMLEKLYNAFTKVDLAAGNQVTSENCTSIIVLRTLPYIRPQDFPCRRSSNAFAYQRKLSTRWLKAYFLQTNADIIFQGTLTRADMEQSLRTFFPLKDDESIEALMKACEQESPGESVQYKNLFTEVRKTEARPRKSCVAALCWCKFGWITQGYSFVNTISISISANACHQFIKI